VNAGVSRDPDAVRAMFGRIARRYDLANHLLSGGADFLWRRRATKIVTGWRPLDVLDLATGSGDLALSLQRGLPEATITAADFSPEMLEVARRKGVAKTILADALQLPFESGSFDCVTVAFVLDFSIPRGALRTAYRFYLHRCLPLLASIVTGEKVAYDYLGGSIEKFPSGAAMLELIERNGFTMAAAEPLTGGIATIYSAQKL
jgi:demethylmenaquinone methyltransferase/2-methoxy-6-polyprenyl-1,4-benzoquinol methylase